MAAWILILALIVDSKSGNYSTMMTRKHMRLQVAGVRASTHIIFKTASTIATSVVHSKLDYCNSLYYNLPQSQIKRLQNIQNSLARAVTRTPKSSHITPVLKSLHWLKINESIKYKLLSLSKCIRFTQQTNLKSPQLDFCSTLSQHTFFIYGHSCSSTYPVLFENH